jgi:DinB superfamily
MTAIEVLLRSLDQAYDRKSWHGTNLRGSLRGLTAAEASWRPAPDRHNVWELAVHCAYWKYSVLRRLHGLEKGSFALPGSNWFERPIEPVDKTWKMDLELLADTHRQLRDAVAQLDPEDLATVPAGSKTSVLDLVVGVAAHDLYHAGQIQLIKKLRPR